MSWLKDRLNSLLDNLIWIGLLALAVAVGGSLLAFGGEGADLPIWAVVLFGAVLVCCIVAVCVLFRRVANLERAPAAPLHKPPHPYADLLRRIDALAEVVGKRVPEYPAEWEAAEAFNLLLRDALDTGDPALADIPTIRRGEGEGWDNLAHSATYGTVTTLLARLRPMVEYAKGPEDRGPR